MTFAPRIPEPICLSSESPPVAADRETLLLAWDVVMGLDALKWPDFGLMCFISVRVEYQIFCSGQFFSLEFFFSHDIGDFLGFCGSVILQGESDKRLK